MTMFNASVAATSSGALRSVDISLCAWGCVIRLNYLIKQGNIASFTPFRRQGQRNSRFEFSSLCEQHRKNVFTRGENVIMIEGKKGQFLRLGSGRRRMQHSREDREALLICEG